jgi:hypothetical protein
MSATTKQCWLSAAVVVTPSQRRQSDDGKRWDCKVEKRREHNGDDSGSRLQCNVVKSWREYDNDDN